MRRLPLDPAGQHWVEPDGRLATRDPLSALHVALAAHLVVGDTVRLGDVVLGTRAADGWAPETRLTALELRFLADRGFPHPTPAAVETFAPRTDLHTHFAGCVHGADLVGIGAATGVVFPAKLLALAGIAATADIPLAAAPDAVRDALARALSLPLDTQHTHKDMDRVYALRRPITKHRPAFPALCAQIAADYAAMGVTYAELSLFDILEPDLLRMAHDTVPALRAETGVDLRFLAALSRHDDLEWDLDMVGRLEAYAGSALIVGVDFMGHETTSTHAFVPALRAVARFAREHRPDFAVRVHAGENPMFPENVRVAVDTALEEGCALRIGHGLYGVDDATLERMVAHGVIVELNLDSNFALNNVGDALQVPLARYVASGVPIVLGTDGYGIYGSDTRAQARAAALTGLDDADRVRRTEAAVLAARAEADGRMASGFVAPLRAPEPVHFTAEVAKRIEAERAADAEALRAAIARTGVPLREARDLEPGRWVSVAGAWKHAWARLPDGDRDRIRTVLDGLVAGLAARGATLVTGGTVHGVEGCVHEAARRHGARVVGAVVDATPPDDLDRVSAFVRVGRTLYEKAAGLYALLAEHDGLAVFVDGGNIVHDEIRVATNLRLRRAFFAGVPGASGIAAERWPDRGFTSAQALLARLDGTPAPPEAHWYAGPNPCVDVVCVRTGSTGPEVLLVQRRVEVATESGRWSLPGGFVRTDAARGAPWAPGRETPETAALRVVAAETGLDVGWLREALVPVGVYEGGGRDPRDTAAHWSRSHAFRLDLPAALGLATLVASSDARATAWFGVDALPALAFDHARIAAEALS
ncbi:MAG: NUDIX domain-containing protein [Alphaproteobacteria bacterium]|nr:NUDIX domain-containing protein [Alphaproteobacteria bacterium]